MREIKFRAWDKERNRMILFDNAFVSWFYEDDYRLNAYEAEGTRNDCGGMANDDYEDEKPKTIIMQYTGLKDKKDKEYYEGDICVLSNDRKKGIYTVVWQENGFKLEIIVRKKYGDESWSEKVHVPIFPNSYEVIGNIYENPELLEVTQ